MSGLTKILRSVHALQKADALSQHLANRLSTKKNVTTVKGRSGNSSVTSATTAGKSEKAAISASPVSSTQENSSRSSEKDSANFTITYSNKKSVSPDSKRPTTPLQADGMGRTSLGQIPVDTGTSQNIPSGGIPPDTSDITGKPIYPKEGPSTQSTVKQDKCQSFVKNAFIGKHNWSEVFPYPFNVSEYEKKSLKFMIEPLSKYFADIQIKKDHDAATDLKSDNVLKSLWEMGLFGTQVPTAFGGMGLTNSQYARLSELVGTYDLSIAMTLGAHQSIGFKGLMIYGSYDQKQKYLNRVTRGELCAFCLTEAECDGGKSCTMKSRAVLTPDGKSYVLNGSKMWVSNGGTADIMTVFAQTPEEGHDKITAFIVEKGFKGVKHGPPIETMGVRAANTAQIFYENVIIPKENVLGGVGNGFKVAMNILNNGRFGMAAALSGTMKTCIQKSVEFATKRQQFGQRIDTFGGIQEKIARMAILQYVTESMAYMIAANMDKGSQHYHMEAAISKCFASEAAWYTCDEAIQIMGGLGFIKETGLERIMRDLRVFRIFEGTNDILKLFVGLTGLQYAMSHFEDVQNVLKNPQKTTAVMLEEAKDRFARIFGIIYSNSLADYIHHELTKTGGLLSKNINLFASVVEIVLIKYGKKVANEQFIVNRIAQAAMDIYASAVVLSRASKALYEQTPSCHHERIMAEAWTLEAYDRVVKNLSEITVAKHLRNHSRFSEISRNICMNGGVVQNNPLNI